MLNLVNNMQNLNVPSIYLPRDVSRKRASNDINEALFCNRPSEFTQTKRMVGTLSNSLLTLNFYGKDKEDHSRIMDKQNDKWQTKPDFDTR
jgi:hypothetical protein